MSQKTKPKRVRLRAIVSSCAMAVCAASAFAQTGGKEQPAGSVALKLDLPKPAFKGTPKNAPPGVTLEEPRKGPRPPLMVPQGVELRSTGKPVTASDDDPIMGEIKFVTDGDADAKEGSYVELGPGVQWAQIDLGAEHTIHAVLIWHYHINARIYRDVIVQVSNDVNFKTGVTTIFNNDHDNSAGVARGDAKEYWETYEGKLIEAQGVKGRYVRAYSNGSTEDDQNHYTEMRVYGK